MTSYICGTCARANRTVRVESDGDWYCGKCRRHRDDHNASGVAYECAFDPVFDDTPTVAEVHTAHKGYGLGFGNHGPADMILESERPRPFLSDHQPPADERLDTRNWDTEANTWGRWHNGHRHDADGQVYLGYYRVDLTMGFIWDGCIEHPVQVTREMGEPVIDTFEPIWPSDLTTPELLAAFKRVCNAYADHTEAGWRSEATQ